MNPIELAAVRQIPAAGSQVCPLEVPTAALPLACATELETVIVLARAVAAAKEATRTFGFTDAYEAAVSPVDAVRGAQLSVAHLAGLRAAEL